MPDERINQIKVKMWGMQGPWEAARVAENRADVVYLLNAIEKLEKAQSGQVHALLPLEEQDMDRHARAVRAIEAWRDYHKVFITVDDSVNIVSAVLKSWQAVNYAEAQRDTEMADLMVRKFRGEAGHMPVVG